VRVRGGILGRRGTKGRALLHALEDEVDPVAVSLLHPSARRFQIILFADSLLCPRDRNLLMASVGLHPVLVVVRALGEDLFGDHRYSDHLPEKVDDLLGPGQPRQIAVDDKTVETVIHKQQQASKKACEKLHRSVPPFSCLSNKIIGETTDGVKISNIFG